MAQRQHLTCFMILFQHSVLSPPPFFEENVNFHSSLVSIHSPHVNEKQKRGWGERKAKQFYISTCVPSFRTAPRTATAASWDLFFSPGD